MFSATTSLGLKQIGKELLSLAFPMAMTQLIAVGSGFVCMAMVAGLGHDVLAASALIFSSRLCVLIVGSSILFALAILIGHAYGENNYPRIGNFMRLGWTMGLLLSLPLMAIFYKIHVILLFFGQSTVLVNIVHSFFKANIWNVLPFLLSVSNQQLLYGIRKQQIDLVANFLGVIVLITSSYLFVFGHFGFPKLGVEGLGYALDLQGWCYFLFTMAVIYWGDFFKRFDLFAYRIEYLWDDLKQMMKIAWPISFQMGGEMLFFFVSTAMVGWLGVQSLAAYQVVTQYLILVIVPLFALSQASGVLIGQANGEKNYPKIKKIGTVAFICSYIITLIVSVLFFTIPKVLAKLYLDINAPQNALTVHLIVMLFSIVAISQIFDNTRNVVTGALRGIFDTKFPMYVGFFILWLIALPLGYLLAFPFRLGVAGIAIGGAIGMFVGALLVMYRWQKLAAR